MRFLSSSLAALALVLPLSLPRFRVNITDSLPRGIYKVSNEPLARGVIVAECLPPKLASFAKERGYLEEGGCPDNTMPILKRVEGMPGDTVELTQAYVAVNDRLVLNSETQKKDSKGREIPAVERGTFVLKPGQVFLMATNSERSWDNRYTGPTDISDIIETLQPWWTEAGNGL